MAVGISMVLFVEEPQLSAADIIENLTAKWPEISPATDVEEGDPTLTFRIGSNDVFITNMSMPFPWSDLEGPCHTSILWKNAVEELIDHKSHVMVTITSDLEPIELSTLLTQVTAAVMAT